MNNVKVKGVLDENGIKNFMITNTDSGEVHVAMREGQFNFRVGEFVGTLKQCKQLVSASEVVHFADAKTEVTESSNGSWDCCHPCALLILLAEGDVSRKEIDRTLDAFGWLTPEGTRDIEAAKESLEKWRVK